MKKIFLILLISLFTFNAFAATEAQPKESFFDQIENWYSHNMNYGSITLLMAVESTFVPLPSEIVIPPAAYVASKGESSMNIYLIILFGTLGAFLGASFNYVLALILGRPLLRKFADSKAGKLFLLSGEKIDNAEDYFKTHGKTSTFVGRLIPGVRHLISIPAGLAKMNYFTFAFFTITGALIWNIILALVGYWAGGQSELIDQYSHEIGNAFLIILIAVAVFYGFKLMRKKLRK